MATLTGSQKSGERSKQESGSVLSSSSSTSWQPPSIPTTIGASFQSWLRPNSSATPTSRSPSRPSSAASNRKASNDVPAEEVAEAVLPNDVGAAGLLPPSNVTLRYDGRYDQLSAQAELWLYSLSTPYFKGAQLGNVNNRLYWGDRDAFTEMWREIQGPSSSASSTSSSSSSSSSRAERKVRTYSAEQRATMGTELHLDGKVGSIRWVSVDGSTEEQAAQNQGHGSSWLSWVPGFGPAKPEKCLNVLEIGTPMTPEQRKDKDEESLVLLHGYGAGTGFFFQNIASLASRPNSRLYALDWLGMGRSSRPNYHVPSAALKSDTTRVEAAETFFVDSLEEWRKSAGVEKMKIIAHSLGGYLSVAYALRYPQRVSRLVLISPAGCGANPEESGSGNNQTFAPKNATYIPEKDRNNADADAASVHSIEREVLEPQKNTIEGSSADSADKENLTNEQIDKARRNNGRGNGRQPPRFSSRTRSVFAWLWERNFSPFGVLRTSGFMGPYLMGNYTRRRFGSLEEESLKALHGYCQGIFLAKGSGEYCLAHLLLPGAWARVPMIDRVDDLPKSLPISFIYGEMDWMDVEAGRAIVKKLKTNLGNPNGRVYVVAHAGHHTYLDNPKANDRLVAKLLDGQGERIAA